ncbi:MAG: hypothetical protein WCC81_19890 [Pseudolabrys sp.]
MFGKTKRNAALEEPLLAEEKEPLLAEENEQREIIERIVGSQQVKSSTLA